MESLKKTLRNNLKAVFENGDISQKELCEKINVSSSTIHRWLTGETWPSDKHLEDIAQVFGVNPTHLFMSNFKPIPSTIAAIKVTMDKLAIVKKHPILIDLAGQIDPNDEFMEIILGMMSTHIESKNGKD